MSNHHNFLPTRAAFFISSAGRVDSVREFKIEVFVLLFNCGDTHLHYQIKVHQNWFDSFNCSSQTDIQISNLCFASDKWKIPFRVFVNYQSEFVM